MKAFFPPLFFFFSPTPKYPGRQPWCYAYPKLGNTGVNEDLEKAGNNLYFGFLLA